MDPDEVYRELAAALRQAQLQRDANAAEIEALRATVALLIEVLAGLGRLEPGHPALLSKRAERARQRTPVRVRLRNLGDKHSWPSADIDCASRVHLCKAKCCTLEVELSEQDLAEGGLSWDVQRPYVLRREPSGYCTHYDCAGGGCTVYDRRPIPCRAFDCRGDDRIWADFDAMIPAEP